ncbi:MAG: hypothetical protein U0531_01355 [Dehalococcoidia bacterium]
MLAHIREREPCARRFRPCHARHRLGLKPEKLALEHLHTACEVMTARRRQFQRLRPARAGAARVGRRAGAVTGGDAAADGAHRRAALGVAGALAARLLPNPAAGAGALLESLADEGALLRVRIDELDQIAYVHPTTRRRRGRRRRWHSSPR